MNLKTRLAKLEKHQPQMDQEQRQAMIASIEQWLGELEVKAQTDPETRLYLGHTRCAGQGHANRAKGLISWSPIEVHSRLKQEFEFRWGRLLL
jgi:hypothetical protein